MANKCCCGNCRSNLFRRFRSFAFLKPSWGPPFKGLFSSCIFSTTSKLLDFGALRESSFVRSGKPSFWSPRESPAPDFWHHVEFGFSTSRWVGMFDITLIWGFRHHVYSQINVMSKIPRPGILTSRWFGIFDITLIPKPTWCQKSPAPDFWHHVDLGFLTPRWFPNQRDVQKKKKARIFDITLSLDFWHHVDSQINVM